MRARWLVLALAACGGTSPRPEPNNVIIPEADKSMPQLGTLLDVPVDSPVLPGQLEGLILSEGQEPWGLSFSSWDARQREMPREPLLREAGPRPTYQVSVLGSPYGIYFRSSGEGVQFERNIYFELPSKDTTNYDVAFYTPATPNRFGLSEPAHLVALDVNDRRGAAGGRMVATAVRVLDREYGIAPTQLLASLRTRFDAAVAARSAEMQLAFDDGKEKLLGGMHSTIESQALTKSVAIWPSWRASDRTLRVVFVLEWLRGRTSHCEHTPGDPTLFALKIYCEPNGTRLSYGAAMAAVYRTDVKGNVLEQAVYAPMGYAGDLRDQQQTE